MGEYVNFIRQKFLDAQRKISAVEERANRETDEEANKYAAKVLTPEIETGILLAYRDAVSAWYNAYHPKMYNRTYSLYNVIRLKEVDGIYDHWEYVDDGLNKASLWGGVTFNIYDLVFASGSHGGPLFHYVPPVSTPIPEMFDNNERDYIAKNSGRLQKQFNQLGDNYFNQNALDRVKKRIRETYGNEFDWLIG